MIIGVPKEIKNNENRVGLTPAGVAELRKHGHSLLVQAGAGEGSGFADGEYEQAGAVLLPPSAAPTARSSRPRASWSPATSSSTPSASRG